jgi:hypothetical protein
MITIVVLRSVEVSSSPRSRRGQSELRVALGDPIGPYLYINTVGSVPMKIVASAYLLEMRFERYPRASDFLGGISSILKM